MQPLDLDLDAGAVQARLGEVLGERCDGRAIAPVEGAERLGIEGLRGGGSHGGPIGARQAATQGRRADRGFELPEERPARALDHTEDLVEHSRPGIVRVGHVEAARGRVERHQQARSCRRRPRCAPTPQDALVAAVERDDEVAVREVGRRELASAVLRAVVPAALERVDRALIGAFADVPVAGAGAGRADAIAAGRRDPRTAGRRPPPSASGRCCRCRRTRRGRDPRWSRSLDHSGLPRAILTRRGSAPPQHAGCSRPSRVGGDRGIPRPRGAMLGR